MKKQIILLVSIAALLITSCKEPVNQETSVKVVGAMRHVMHEGKLEGSILIDTLGKEKGLYGLGPIEYLAGEILILDGKTYISKVINDTAMMVEQSNNVKAPFFVYSKVHEWKEYELPNSVTNLKTLEHYIDRKTRDEIRPFTFKVEGTIQSADIHIVNLPKGTKVSSPEEAHQGLTSFKIGHEEVTLIGYFSTEHKAVFTHHDTFMHLHLITKNRKKWDIWKKLNSFQEKPNCSFRLSDLSKSNFGTNFVNYY